MVECEEGASQARGCRGEPSSRRLRKQHLRRRRNRNGTPTTAAQTPKPRRELGVYPHAGEGSKTMRKRKTQIQAPPKRKPKQKNPQRPPPERHICVIVQPNNSGNRVVWSAPELHPPQLAIDCGVCIHPQRLLFECRWNVAEASKTRQPTISEVPHSPRDVATEQRIMDELCGPPRRTRPCVASGMAPAHLPAIHSYPAWGFRVDPLPHRFRYGTPVCGPP